MNGLVRSVAYAFAAQGAAILLSTASVLVLPKVLGVQEFGYWQLYILYLGYVGLFHFGLNDGIYLRLGGRAYRDIDYPLIGTQFRLSVLIEGLVALLLGIVTCSVVEDPKRSFVILASLVYLVTSNASLFLGYVFQAVGHTHWYSTSVIFDRVFALILFASLVFGGQRVVEPFIIAYSVANSFRLLYCLVIGRSIVTSGWYDLRTSLREMVDNVTVGIQLMLANVAGMLILGFGLLLIDYARGIEAFGMLSLAVTLANFFLLFIGQLGMVLFPALRRVSAARLGELFPVSMDAVALFLPAVFVVYSPMRIILENWLPQYTEGLRYLALILPICVFDGKMQLVLLTYLKVLREERRILVYNLVAMIFSASMSLVAVFLLHSTMLVIVSMVAGIWLRGLLSERYLTSRLCRQFSVMRVIVELFTIGMLAAIAWSFEPEWALALGVVVYGLYLLLNSRRVKPVLSYVSTTQRS